MLRYIPPVAGWMLGLMLVFSGTKAETPADQPHQSPVHEQIDALIESHAIGPLSPSCSDANFMRRITLDLTGNIPSAEEVTEFLADEAANKCEALADRLLQGAEFSRYMAVVLDVMLLERRSEPSIAVGDWERYLIEAIANNKSLDDLYQELIFQEESEGAERRIPEKFVLSRTAEPNAVTRDVGRLAFGRDLQCAQCHDHPLVDDYLQDEYYGLYAFWHRTGLFTDPKSKTLQLSELAEGEASFTSVFSGSGREAALPMLPRGRLIVAEPVHLRKDAYVVEPAKDAAGKPKYSRRKVLAEALSENPQFRRNLANRLWQMVFGRGLVHPVDLHHLSNPPSNPELLQLLADTLVAEGFQLRPMLKHLVMTRAYQRSCEAPDPNTVNFRDIAARCQQVEAGLPALRESAQTLREQLKIANEQYAQLLRQQEAVAAKLPSLLKAADEAQTICAKSLAKLDETRAAMDKLQAQRSALHSAAEATTAAAALLNDDKPLAEMALQLAGRAEKLADAVAKAEQAYQQATDAHQVDQQVGNQALAALSETAGQQITPEQLEPVEGAFLQLADAHEQSVYRLKSAQSQVELGDLASNYASTRSSDPVSAEAIWQNLVQRWTIGNQVAPLKALTPEQLSASILSASGSWTAQLEAAATKLDQAPPESLKSADESNRTVLRERYLQAALLDQLRGTVKQFVDLYGGLPGEDFQATVNQALFFGNSGLIEGFLKPTGDNLTQRLLSLEDPSQIVDELCLAILSRPAEDQERGELLAILAEETRPREEVIREIAWALLSSTEFRFNH